MGKHMTQSALAVGDVSLTLQGMAPGTEILTADGALPVEYLAEGDRIVTRSGLRVLRSVSVQVVRHAAMVQLGVDTLGVGRPDHDVLVAAGQTILIRDWRAQALFGTPQALVPACRLVDGSLIRAQARANLRIYTLHFDATEVIYAGGLELSCAPAPVAA
jgi:hypothetical protein